MSGDGGGGGALHPIIAEDRFVETVTTLRLSLRVVALAAVESSAGVVGMHRCHPTPPLVPRPMRAAAPHRRISLSDERPLLRSVPDPRQRLCDERYGLTTGEIVAPSGVQMAHQPGLPDPFGFARR